MTKILARDRWIAFLAGAVCAIAIAVHSGASRSQENLPGAAAVLDELRAGGLVIYFRHAATDSRGPNDASADMANCNTQRNLSALGRSQSVRIGESFRRLAIPVGRVVSSPFCRTKETAELAFGRTEIDGNLFFAITAAPEDVERLSAALRQMLSTPPVDGRNTIVVSHTANLKEAAGIWPKTEGMAYVFRPHKNGKFEAVASVLPDEWESATRDAGDTARR